METTKLSLLLKRFWWIAVLVLIFLVAAVSLVIIRKDSPESDSKEDNVGNSVGEKKDENSPFSFHWPSKTAIFVTAVPVDLEQIQSISKFRSCAGHIRDGYNFDREREYDSSMKHYWYPVPEYQGTIDQVKMYAPFDGTIIEVIREEDKGFYGRINAGHGIAISTDVDENVKFIFGHMYFVEDLEVGDEVEAGQLLGYAALGEDGNDFDIDVTSRNRNDEIEVLDSVFDHMTDEVLAEFARYGLTPENTKFTQEYREANPCNYPDVDPSLSGRENEGWVQLVHPANL